MSKFRLVMTVFYAISSIIASVFEAFLLVLLVARCVKRELPEATFICVLMIWVHMVADEGWRRFEKATAPSASAPKTDGTC